ncbi:hypothetical protein EST38_g5477 [Candolleomyces aberdarensis]|uniref:RRM domain-containing protein n=1 Tax=Candolleomyces aberdarensis TaxID=2316362 RepID=A0A4V1Q401_9AGAR|nr:hypothetical protein EST38_g5477 [Candolleomyces aberdarensis]
MARITAVKASSSGEPKRPSATERSAPVSSKSTSTTKSAKRKKDSQEDAAETSKTEEPAVDQPSPKKSKTTSSDKKKASETPKAPPAKQPRASAPTKPASKPPAEKKPIEKKKPEPKPKVSKTKSKQPSPRPMLSSDEEESEFEAEEEESDVDSEEEAEEEETKVQEVKKSKKIEGANTKAKTSKPQEKKKVEEDSESEAGEEEDDEEVHLHGFSTDEDSSDEDSDMDAEPSAFDVAKLPTIAKDDATVKKKLEKAKRKPTGNRGVLFLGRIPHGFYEDQMRAYFSQFGDVTRLRLSRNKKTGKSKHYGFIEFDSESVAKIVAETMDNYLMNGHIMQCKLIPKDKVHPQLWVGANRKWRTVPPDQLTRARHNKKRDETEQYAAARRLVKRQNQRKRKLEELGINYNLDSVGYKKPKAVEAN